jgi:UDP-N-acetylglucosamine 2-epimerase (non-hydrolysing)
MKISVIFGTRPEAIKLAPVILALRDDRRFSTQVCTTAQHRHMLDQVLDVFGIVPDTDLDLMRPDQSLSNLTCSALIAVGEYLKAMRPDLVLVQGDTTTVFATSLAAAGPCRGWTAHGKLEIPLARGSQSGPNQPPCHFALRTNRGEQKKSA